MDFITDILKNLSYWSYLFMVLAGSFNGLMDLLQFRFNRSIFSDATRFDQQNWNPKLSWRNKYLMGDPDYGPKFRFSTTALVFLTDYWHFFQWMTISFIAISVLVYSQGNATRFVIDAIFLRFVCWQGGFWLIYETRILKIKS